MPKSEFHISPPPNRLLLQPSPSRQLLSFLKLRPKTCESSLTFCFPPSTPHPSQQQILCALSSINQNPAPSHPSATTAEASCLIARAPSWSRDPTRAPCSVFAATAARLTQLHSVSRPVVPLLRTFGSLLPQRKSSLRRRKPPRPPYLKLQVLFPAILIPFPAMFSPKEYHHLTVYAF